MVDEIIEYPSPILSRAASLVQPEEFGTDELNSIINRMIAVINDTGANGLAAVQIGVDKALIVYRNKVGTLLALCNPTIIARTGKVKSYGEGCLSSPGFRTDKRRSKEIKIRVSTVEGKEVIVREKGYPAIILQHEIDHINGITLIRLASDDDQDKREYMRRIKRNEDIST